MFGLYKDREVLAELLLASEEGLSLLQFVYVFFIQSVTTMEVLSLLMSVINLELILVKLVLYVFTRGCEENLILITVLQDVIPCSFGSPLLMCWQNFCLHLQDKMWRQHIL